MSVCDSHLGRRAAIHSVGKDGNVVAKLEGAAEWDSKEIVEWLKTLTEWQKAP